MKNSHLPGCFEKVPFVSKSVLFYNEIQNNNRNNH